MRELSPQQKRNVSELMKSGFEGYASTHGDRMRIGAVIDSPEKNTALIRSYGMEFVRILSQSEWTELREDLFFLTEKGCPALDIIQLTFACTRGRSLATSDTLAGTLDTPEKLTAAVYEKMVAGLKSLRLWKDSLKKQFKDYVAEEVDWQEERKEVRSRAAKKGAATRKRNSESGFQKKLDALREFNVRNAGEAPATKTHVAGTNRVSDGIGWTLCGKAIHETQKGEGAALIKNGEKPTCGTCLKHKGYLYGEIQKKNRKEQEQRKAEQEAAVEEKHTGQHEDCAECLEYEQEKQQQEERIEKKRSAAYKAWYKRIQTLIDTWRNFRLKEENKYREEFQKASDKYLARLKRGGLDTRGVYGESIVKEARDRMEGAIADRNRFYPPTAPATAEESPVAPVAQALEQTIADTGGVEPKPWEQADWKEKSWHDRILVPGSPEREEWKERCLRNAELQREIEIAEEDEEFESEEGDESEEVL